MPTNEMTALPKYPTQNEKRLRHKRVQAATIKEHGSMRIRFLQGLAGVDFAHERGDEVDWRADEAKRLIEQGIAVPIPQDSREMATTGPPSIGEMAIEEIPSLAKSAVPNTKIAFSLTYATHSPSGEMTGE